MLVSIAASRISISRGYDTQALRAWLAFVLVGVLKVLALLTITRYPLAAQGIANRLWLAVILVLFARETISILTRPNLYVLALFFWTFLGVFSGNPIGDIVADGTIMMLPAIFWRQLCLNGVNDGRGFADFSASYFELNVIGLLCFSLIGFVSPLGIGMDWNFLIPAFLSNIFTSAYWLESFFFFLLFAIASFLSLSSKTALGNIAIAAIAMTRGRVTLIIAGTLISALILIAVLPFVLEETTAGSKLNKLLSNADFSRLAQIPITNLILNPALIFHFLDISTGERLFELLNAIKKISGDWVHLLFGYGLGAGLDLSNSADKSVLGSHSDTQDIRVVHLAVTWALLKGGLTGLIAYLLGTGWAIWHGVLNICSSRLHRDYRWVWLGSIVALLMVFSMQFAVSVFIKMPTIAIGLMAIALGRKLRRKILPPMKVS